MCNMLNIKKSNSSIVDENQRSQLLYFMNILRVLTIIISHLKDGLSNMPYVKNMSKGNDLNNQLCNISNLKQL